MKIWFDILYILFVNTHTKIGIKVFEMDFELKFNDIFDLLTLPQGHQFDPRVKILLALCSSHHPLQFDMPHDYVLKKIF